MCGFVGFLNTPGGGKSRKRVVRAMADRIIHRGPDDADYFWTRDFPGVPAAFHHRPGGRPPAHPQRGRHQGAGVQRGDLQFQSLREDLLKKGPVFKPHRLGDHPPRVRGVRQGDPAKAAGHVRLCHLGTRRRTELFGARDIFGIKPLLLLQKGTSSFVGSEIRAFSPIPAL